MYIETFIYQESEPHPCINFIESVISPSPDTWSSLQRQIANLFRSAHRLPQIDINFRKIIQAWDNCYKTKLIPVQRKEVLVGSLLNRDRALGTIQFVTISEVTKLKAPHIAVNIENVETKTAAIACGIGLSLNVGVR